MMFRSPIEIAAWLFALGMCLSSPSTSSAGDLLRLEQRPLVFGSLYVQGASEQRPVCSWLFSGQIERGDLDPLGPDSVVGYQYDNLCLDSHGGSLSEVLEFNGTVPSTVIMPGRTCESACAILFMMGGYYDGSADFHYSNAMLFPGGQLGFHAPALLTEQGRTYSASEVSDAFSVSLLSASKLFDLTKNNTRFSDSIINDYIFSRILQTPPGELYYIDTVGDALYSDILIAGVSPLVPSVEDAGRNLCDNLYLTDHFGTYNGYWDSLNLSAEDAFNYFIDAHSPGVEGLPKQGGRRIMAASTSNDGAHFIAVGPYIVPYDPAPDAHFCIVRVLTEPGSASVLVTETDVRIVDAIKSTNPFETATLQEDFMKGEAPKYRGDLAYKNFPGSPVWLFPFNMPLEKLPLHPGLQFDHPTAQPPAVESTIREGVARPSASFDLFRGMDASGGDLVANGIRSVSLEQCETICLSTAGCTAFSYVTALQWCWPKAGTGNWKVNPKVVSGRLVNTGGN